MPEARNFARILRRHKDGILDPSDYLIHTSKPEEVNNKIKLINRKTKGFHDLRYYSPEVMQAFSTN